MEDLESRWARRLKTMVALAESVNLYLKVEKAAFKGDASLAQAISNIRNYIPDCHRHSEGTDPFHSFYISQSFIMLISEFEGLLVDVMKAILTKHPKKLGAETFKLSEIIELNEIDNIATVAAERFLNGIMYKRPSDYRREFVKIISANEEFLGDVWPEYIALKPGFNSEVQFRLT